MKTMKWILAITVVIAIVAFWALVAFGLGSAILRLL